MSILCRLGGHEADRAEVWNAGYYFSSCRRCGLDMIRSGGRWQAVPEGHRVVWKIGGERHSVASGHRTNLPVTGSEAAASPFVAWNRQLVRLAGPGIGAKKSGGDDEEPGEAQYPYVLALAAILGAGLQLLLRPRTGRSAHG